MFLTLADSWSYHLTLIVAFTCIVGLLLWIVRWIVRQGLLALQRRLVPEVCRFHQRVFVQKLRELACSDPVGFMTRLWADDRQAFINGLWRDVDPEAKRLTQRFANLPDDGSGVKQLLHIAGESNSGSLQNLTPPDDHLDVTKCRTRTGHFLAIVHLPPTRVSGEAVFFIVALADHASLRQDLQMARRALSFFVLERSRGDRETELTGWTHDGEPRYYNCSAPEDVEGLARLIELKLAQEQERRARQSAAAS